MSTTADRRPAVEQIPFADLGAMTREVRGEVDAGFAQVLDSGRFIGEEFVERFEQEWAAYCDARHAVGVGNGTDALQLALRALDIGPGDEVIVPTNTFVATAEAVVLAGAVPRFADVSPDTLLLTPATATAALSPRARAVVAVHLYGQTPDMEALSRFAASAGLALVEDAAQAHGARWRGRPAGGLADVGCFSFYPSKNLGAFGDAGAVVTDRPDLARRVRSMRDHGRGSSHHRHEFVGTNSRLDALQAVVLSAKLPRLEGWTAARRVLAGRYRDRLGGTGVRLTGLVPGAEHAYHLLVARIPARARIRQRLSELGVQTGLHYPEPCHLQPPYARFADRSLPVAEATAREIVSLPLFPHMTFEQVDLVCDRLSELVALEADADVA